MRDLANSCSECGALLPSEQALYTDRGDLICHTCTMKRDATAAHERSASSAASLAYGNPLLGVASFFFDPFFIVSAGAIGNCLFTLRRIRSDLRRGEVVRHPLRQKVAAIGGAALAAAALVSRFL